MVSTSPLSIRTPYTCYRGYTYFWHENKIKLPLRGKATKHFANEQEAKAYIDSLTAPPLSCSPVTSKTQETKPSSAIAPGVMSGAVANWIGGLPAWLIGLFGRGNGGRCFRRTWRASNSYASYLLLRLSGEPSILSAVASATPARDSLCNVVTTPTVSASAQLNVHPVISLSHQIATKISNTRGYHSLRDGTE